MLPSLALLNTSGTGPPAKRGRLTLDPRLLDLPPDLLGKIVLEATGGRGVPLMMVIKETNDTQGQVIKHDYAYLRLPDPSRFDPDTNVFSEDDYPFPDLLDAIVDYADYTKDSKHPIFVELDDQHDLPLGNTDFDDFEDAMIEFLDHATRFDANGRLEASSFFHSNTHPIVFSTPPEIKSHIAIILTMQLNP